MRFKEIYALYASDYLRPEDFELIQYFNTIDDAQLYIGESIISDVIYKIDAVFVTIETQIQVEKLDK